MTLNVMMSYVMMCHETPNWIWDKVKGYEMRDKGFGIRAMGNRNKGYGILDKG